MGAAAALGPSQAGGGSGSAPPPPHRASVDAAAGAIAGAVARLVVNPLDVVKIRFQVQLEPVRTAAQGAAGSAAISSSGAAPPLSSSHYTGLGQAVLRIVREEGIKGLWRGTVPGQLLTVPYCAVQFVVLQQCKGLFQARGLAGPRGERGRALSFVAGAAAGAAATIVSYPFDLLRTLLAAQGDPPVYRGMTAAARGVLAERGPRGLYSGLGVTLLEIAPYAALQFGLYDALAGVAAGARGRARRRAGLGGEGPAGQQRWDRFLCGLAAGILAKLATHPLDVAKKRYQVAGLQRSLRYGRRVDREAVVTLAGCLRAIWAREGWRGFYKGTLPSVIKAAPSAAVTLAAYEWAVALLTEERRRGAEPPGGARE